MNNQLVFLLLFTLGVFLEALRKIRARNGLYIFLCTALITLLAFIPGKNEAAYDVIFHIWFYIIMFSFVYSVFIAKEALPVIHETVILQSSILYWYCLILIAKNYNLSDYGTLVQFLIILGFVPTIGIIFVSFKDLVLPFILRLGFYIWHIIQTLVFILFLWLSGNLNIMLSPQSTGNLDYIRIIFSGMAFYYLAFNLSLLIYLIPLPKRYQSFAERIEELKEYTKMLSQKFSDNPIKWKQASLIVLIQCGALVANLRYKIIPDVYLLNLSLILGSIPLSYLRRFKHTPEILSK